MEKIIIGKTIIRTSASLKRKMDKFEANKKDLEGRGLKASEFQQNLFDWACKVYKKRFMGIVIYKNPVHLRTKKEK